MLVVKENLQRWIVLFSRNKEGFFTKVDHVPSSSLVMITFFPYTCCKLLIEHPAPSNLLRNDARWRIKEVCCVRTLLTRTFSNIDFFRRMNRFHIDIICHTKNLICYLVGSKHRTSIQMRLRYVYSISFSESDDNEFLIWH